MLLLVCCIPLWVMGQRKQQDIPVKVVVNIIKEHGSQNLILYSKDRPLSIKDFKGRPDAASPGVGATYSGISMAIEGKTENGVLVTTVALTIYFDPSKSWMKKEGKDERVLAHEQNHFDLTAIKACALAQAITGEKFHYGNLKQRLLEMHKVHTDALHQWQYDYDRETRHGTDAAQQAVWSSRIQKELAAATCI